MLLPNSEPSEGKDHISVSSDPHSEEYVLYYVANNEKCLKYKNGKHEREREQERREERDNLFCFLKKTVFLVIFLVNEPVKQSI